MNFTKIKGKDKPQNVVRLPRLGKLRLGVKLKSMKNGAEYPKEVDYFVCTDEVKKVFGEKPKVLPVMFPVENEDLFLKQYYACYGGNQMIKCIGDGEVAERRDTGKKEEMGCPSPEECEYGKKNKCSARMDLMVVIPDVNMGGVYQISTGSVNSSIDVRSGLMMARQLYGRISWVPMHLSREERKIKDPSTGKMMTHWPCKLNPVGTLNQVNQIRSSTEESKSITQFVVPDAVIEGRLDDTPVVMVDDRTIDERGGKTRAAQTILKDIPKFESPRMTTAQRDAISSPKTTLVEEEIEDDYEQKDGDLF